MTTSSSSGLRRKLSTISPLSVTLVLVFAALMTYFLIRTLAASGTATLYTNPGGSQSVVNGQTFTISVRVSTPGNVPVTGAAVYLSYPTSKLQAIGQNYAGSPYTTQLAASDSGGVLRMDRAAFPMVSGGDQLFAQVTFKAIATGSAPISFTGSSVVTSGEDDSNILTQRNGVTYNVSAPSTPASGGSSSPAPASGGQSTGGSSSGSSRPSASGSAPGKPSSSTGNSSSSTSNGSTNADGSTGTSSDGSSTPVSGADSSDGSSNTAPVSGLAITVLDANKRPIKGAAVTVGSQTVQTDNNGVARFSKVASGQQKITVKYNGKKTSQTVRVKDNISQSPQFVKVSLSQDKFNPGWLLAPIMIVVVVALFFLRPWDKKFSPSVATETAPQIISSSQSHDTTEPPTGRKLETPGTVYSPTPQDKDGPPPKQ